jgi:nucleoid-associated protein YgaU
MGVFKFLKNIGRNDEKDAVEAQEEMNRELIKANKLLRFVMGLGLNIEDLRVEYDDGKATLRGRAATQADKEKAILAVGNTEGVAEVDDQMQVSVAEAEARLYTVQKGDSLSKIAKQYYGDPMKYPVIFEANKPMLDNPDLIYPGQVLRIPVET